MEINALGLIQRVEAGGRSVRWRATLDRFAMRCERYPASKFYPPTNMVFQPAADLRRPIPAA